MKTSITGCCGLKLSRDWMVDRSQFSQTLVLDEVPDDYESFYGWISTDIRTMKQISRMSSGLELPTG